MPTATPVFHVTYHSARMSSSSRSSIPSLPPLKLRKRAKTKTLLGNEYEEVVAKTFDLPMPLQYPLGYNEEHLKQGLKFADSAVRHPELKLSPIGTHALRLYKDACAQLLDLEEGDTSDEDEADVQTMKDECISTIRTYEQSFQFVAYLRVTRTSDAQKLQEEIVNLQWTTFYARYGDMLAEACRQLKKEAEAKKKSRVGSCFRELIGRTLKSSFKRRSKL